MVQSAVHKWVFKPALQPAETAVGSRREYTKSHTHKKQQYKPFNCGSMAEKSQDQLFQRILLLYGNHVSK